MKKYENRNFRMLLFDICSIFLEVAISNKMSVHDTELIQNLYESKALRVFVWVDYTYNT